jgi:hypothetical protein
MKFYAGIGPRTTPKDVQEVMTDIAKQLVPTGWCLRSGHAVGADQAFENGAANKQIFLPWEGFNGANSNGTDTAVVPVTSRCVEIAASHHPAWDRCTDGAKRLLCRNVPIILGETLDDPVTCVITWLPEPTYQGGTRHALNIASSYGVPVFDLNQRQDQTDLCKFILNVENRAQQKQTVAA